MFSVRPAVIATAARPSRMARSRQPAVAGHRPGSPPVARVDSQRGRLGQHDNRQGAKRRISGRLVQPAFLADLRRRRRCLGANIAADPAHRRGRDARLSEHRAWAQDIAGTAVPCPAACRFPLADPVPLRGQRFTTRASEHSIQADAIDSDRQYESAGARQNDQIGAPTHSPHGVAIRAQIGGSGAERSACSGDIQ